MFRLLRVYLLSILLSKLSWFLNHVDQRILFLVHAGHIVVIVVLKHLLDSLTVKRVSMLFKSFIVFVLETFAYYSLTEVICIRRFKTRYYCPVFETLPVKVFKPRITLCFFNTILTHSSVLLSNKQFIYEDSCFFRPPFRDFRLFYVCLSL